MNVRRLFYAVAVAVTGLLSVNAAFAKAPLNASLSPVTLDSGAMNNAQAAPQVVWEDVVTFGDAAWCWVELSDVTLPAGSFVRFTGLLDNETQTLDAAQLADWNFRSARFNGASVKVELIAGPNTTSNRVKVSQAMVSNQIIDDGSPRAICGGTDDRIPSANGAVGRWIANTGLCTGWMMELNAGGPDRCFSTAGHCAQGFTSGSMEFNVPNSLANCNTVAPPVADQFPILAPSVVFQNTGPGADWAVYRCGTNNLGQTAFQRYGVAIPLATTGITNGTAVRHIGYGADGGNSCNCAGSNGTTNATRQQSDGVLSGVTTNDIQHNCDICGGDSGGVVIRISDGFAVGNTTHDFGANCPGSSINGGTRITQASWTTARAQCAGSLPVNDQVPAMSTGGMLVLLALMAVAGVLVMRGRQAVA